MIYLVFVVPTRLLYLFIRNDIHSSCWLLVACVNMNKSKKGNCHNFVVYRWPYIKKYGMLQNEWTLDVMNSIHSALVYFVVVGLRSMSPSYSLTDSDTIVTPEYRWYNPTKYGWIWTEFIITMLDPRSFLFCFVLVCISHRCLRKAGTFYIFWNQLLANTGWQSWSAAWIEGLIFMKNISHCR